MAPMPLSAPAGSNQPSGPLSSSTVEIAVATTTVGITKATTARAETKPRPRNRKWAMTQHPGNAIAIVSSVEQTACQSVNHSTPPTRALPNADQIRVSASSWLKAVSRRLAIGKPKNSNKKPAGMATTSHLAELPARAAPRRSTALSRSPDWHLLRWQVARLGPSAWARTRRTPSAPSRRPRPDRQSYSVEDHSGMCPTT